MVYELVIIWTNGDKDIHVYTTREKAERAEINMRIAFGNQIEWSCVRKKIGE